MLLLENTDVFWNNNVSQWAKCAKTLKTFFRDGANIQGTLYYCVRKYYEL